jgi:hypothetical protein
VRVASIATLAGLLTQRGGKAIVRPDPTGDAAPAMMIGIVAVLLRAAASARRKTSRRLHTGIVDSERRHDLGSIGNAL